MPLFTSDVACLRFASVTRFDAPRWSSFPQRPQLELARIIASSSSAFFGARDPGAGAFWAAVPAEATMNANRAADAAHITSRRVCFIRSSFRTDGNRESHVRPQRHMRPPAVLERRQNDVGGDRRPPEHVDADGVRDGIDA